MLIARCEGTSNKEVLMSMVSGLELHRVEITFDTLDVDSRGDVAVASRRVKPWSKPSTALPRSSR